MAKKLKKLILVFLISLVTKWLEDIFIFTGLTLLIVTTYMEFGLTLGSYALGVVLLVLGLLLAKK